MKHLPLRDRRRWLCALSAYLDAQVDTSPSLPPLDVRLFRQDRPPPPPALDRTERTIWIALAGALPAGWLDDASMPVLQLLARQVALSARREGRAEAVVVGDVGALLG
jgi:hypothetical protein